MGLMMLASVGIFVATIHYCLVSVELGVVRDDIRRLAEQIRDSERCRHNRPLRPARRPRSSLVHRHAHGLVRPGRELQPAPHVAGVERPAVSPRSAR